MVHYMVHNIVIYVATSSILKMKTISDPGYPPF